MAAKKSYSKDDLQRAIADVQAGKALSMRAAAHKYGVPPSTLHDHLKGKSKKAGAGGPTVLTAAEEQEVALTYLALADMGFGLTSPHQKTTASLIHLLEACRARIGGNAF